MPESAFEIRRAVLADIPEMLRLMREQAAFEKISHEMVADEEAYAQAFFGSEAIAKAELVELPCRDGGARQIIGIAIYFFCFSSFTGRKILYLEDLHIVPEWRGRGIGTALIRYLAGIARDGGCPRFDWVVLDWNEKAIQFYEKLGAKVLPEWRIVRAEEAAISALADLES